MELTPLPVTHQSQRVGPGSVFVAIKGMRDDGVRYISDAVARGAAEIIVSTDASIDPQIIALCAVAQIPIHRVPNTRAALAELSAALHGYPARSLRMIGVTGTKGKTTTSFLLFHILYTAGRRVALLSSAENRIMDTVYKTDLTTQHPDYLHSFFNQCVQNGIEWVVTEVAAQALSLHRVDGLLFERAIWLNFSREHGEFYTTQDEYWNAKAQLFQRIAPKGAALFPVHDIRMKDVTLAPDVARIEYASDYPVQPSYSVSNPLVQCAYEGELYSCVQLLGEYNSQNVCAAVAVARSLGIESAIIQRALATFPGVPGRLNWYPLARGVTACIDHAHNPASFQVTLNALRQCTKQLILVFGAGGDRDPVRRPLMGKCAAEYGDLLYLTTDNPRSEDPATICQEILQGIPLEHRHKVIIELDRAAAIRQAITAAAPGAIVALLGKGPDEYQVVGHIKHPFSERAILNEFR